MVSITLIRWIVIYPVDSAIHRINHEKDNSKAPVCSIKRLLFPSTAGINRSFGTPIEAIQGRITVHLPPASPKPTLTLTLKAKCWLRGGVRGEFSRNVLFDLLFRRGA